MARKQLAEIFKKPESGEWGEEDLTGNGVNVLRTTNFTDTGVIDYNDVVKRKLDIEKLHNKWLRVGDIIIEKSGGSEIKPVGRVVYFTGKENEYVFNNFTSVLRDRCKDSVDSRYVFFHLLNLYRKRGTVRYSNRTTGIHNLKLSMFLNNESVELIEIDKQKEKVLSLDLLINVINRRKQQLVDLDNLIKSRFVEMFGDPVSNPKGWETRLLGDVLRGKPSNGFFAKNTEYTIDGDSSVMWIVDIVNRMYSNIDCTKRINAKDEDVKKYSVQYGDLLFCRSSLNVDGIGKASMVPKNVKPRTLFECHIIRIPLDMSVCLPEFIQILTTTVGFRNQIMSKANTATMTTINQDGICSNKIYIPPLFLQNQFADFVQQVDKSKVVIQKSLDETQELFDCLMQKYFG